MKHLLTLLCVTGIVGCATTTGIETTSVEIVGPQGEKTYSTYIKAANPTMAERIAVLNFIRQDIGGLVKASVTLQSRTSDTEALQYRWVWFDGHGFEVNSAAQPWQPLLVYGQQSTSVQGLAPNPSVKDVKLHVRYQE